MTLGEFLQSRIDDCRPWNCSTLAADWCVELGHRDFAAEWRGLVDEAECTTVQAEAGGLITLWDRGIGGALPVVAEPKQGDIAVLVALGHEVGGIFTGGRWAIRGERKMHFVGQEQSRALKVWRP